MKNFTNYIFRFVVTILVSIAPNFAAAGIVTIYDDLSLVVYSNDDEISGYYYARNDQFGCSFFFFSDKTLSDSKTDGANKRLDMLTFDFPPNKLVFTYGQRDPRFDIPGELYLNGNDLTLRTSQPQPGCMSVAGLFDAAPGERGAMVYSAVNKLDAIGIRVVTKRARVYKAPTDKASKGYLLPHDIVVSLNRRGIFEYVRHVNPDMAIDGSDPQKVVTGWVRKSDLENPFPSSPLKELQSSNRKREVPHD
ncbi:MAG TPA: hypothetical protein VN289_13495 [Paraburkholderia sp.]|jgi:hypothetical protein|nr:hypothetical protein [Paraburkholderia sp.]